MKQIAEEDLRREAQKLLATGKMPTLEELCRVVLESRMKYTLKIRRARREGR
jgi:hypothetical protein